MHLCSISLDFTQEFTIQSHKAKVSKSPIPSNGVIVCVNLYEMRVFMKMAQISNTILVAWTWNLNPQTLDRRLADLGISPESSDPQSRWAILDSLDLSKTFFVWEGNSELCFLFFFFFRFASLFLLPLTHILYHVTDIECYLTQLTALRTIKVNMYTIHLYAHYTRAFCDNSEKLSHW